MADSKIVILGAMGMLGTDVAKACQNNQLNATVLDLPQFDITDKAQLTEALSGAETVINCAAYTDVEKAQTQSDLAHKVNAQAVANLGSIAKKNGQWVLHISTDFVFDGEKTAPYVETDEPNPINEYGKSKLAGEKLFIESGCKGCIMRIQWTYGHNGNNFVKKLISLAKTRDSLKVVTDQVGSPTATTEVAGAILELVAKKPTGIFHFAGDGYVSRFEMAEFIFQKLGINIELKKCPSSEFQSDATRPLNSCFDCGKIKSILAEPIKKWQGPLENFLRKL